MSLMSFDPHPLPMTWFDITIEARFIYKVNEKIYDFVKIEFAPTENDDIEDAAKRILWRKLQEEGHWLYNHGRMSDMTLESLIIVQAKKN